ncbi:MAG TPA: matrixin family metalloprotease [Candidatus Saccharimonadales bacterium]|nr:matrixin family metalloprotease [Candidatus Saccharimonadales bacterium]
MKTILIIVVTVVIAGFIVTTYPQLKSQALNIVMYSQCDAPTAYKLGALDAKFGLTNKLAEEDIQKATNIWSKAYDKTLFTNNFNAVLTVNFVYDERSYLNSQISQLENQLSNSNKSIQQQIGAYEADLIIFEKKVSNFKSKVQGLESSGKMTREVYNSLVSEQNALIAEGNALNAKAKSLNLATTDYNSQVKTLNQNVGEFNQSISQKPEEGLYDPSNNTITIYFASNQDELIHTLAHEFGHSLGMQHVQDPLAIMYPSASSTFLTSQEDLQELSLVCMKHPVFYKWLQELIIVAHSIASTYNLRLPFVQDFVNSLNNTFHT